MPEIPVGQEAGLFYKLTESMFRLPEDTGVKPAADTLHIPGVSPLHDSATGTTTRLSAIYGDRLKIIGTGPVTEHHLRKLELLPDSFHKKIAEYLNGHPEGGLYIVDGPVTDVLTDLRGVRPRGWPEGKTWDDVPGATRTPTHRVILGGPPENSPLVSLHEPGHALDHALGEPSHSPEFRALYDKLGTLYPYLRQPGDAGREETFAQGFSAWAHNPHLPPDQRARAVADALGIKVDKKFRGDLVNKYFNNLQHRLESHPN